MNPRLLLVLAALAASLSAAPAITENFDAPLDVSTWKLDSASFAEGRLRLDAIGDETVFVGASIETAYPRPELNFALSKVIITMEDIELGGLAPSEKQAFVMHLGSDRSIGANRALYVRLGVNGNGNAVLAVSVPAPDGHPVDHHLVSRPVTFPIKKLVLALDRQGYRFEITDAFAPNSTAAAWSSDIGWAQWEKAAPYLFLKAVRRPAPGTCEVRIGSLTVESDPVAPGK